MANIFNYTFNINDKSEMNDMALGCMEQARQYHEQYLIKGSRTDLDNAVDSYIDAIKFNPNISF